MALTPKMVTPLRSALARQLGWGNNLSPSEPRPCVLHRLGYHPHGDFAVASNRGLGV